MKTDKFFWCKGDVASKWMCILYTDPSCQNRFILTIHWIICVKLFCLTNRKSGNQIWQLGPVQEIYIFFKEAMSPLFLFFTAKFFKIKTHSATGKWILHHFMKHTLYYMHKRVFLVVSWICLMISAGSNWVSGKCQINQQAVLHSWCHVP